MKKETIADKIARKSFDSAKFQQSWQVHMQAFGPILEPAFVEDYQAKVHLTAALNFISKRNVNKGMAKLQEVKKHIVTDEDKTLYLFVAGLCYEMAGDLPRMTELYDCVNEYNHKFYLPYMKAAKFHQQCGSYDVALERYMKAVDCFSVNPTSEQEKLIVASAHINMVTCLTMMHEYEEALTCLEDAYSFGVKVPNSASVEAVLFAAMGEKEKAENSLVQLDGSPVYDHIKKTVESILNKTNPAFFPVETDVAKIEAFWNWFMEYCPILEKRLDDQQYEEGMTPISEKLLETFPFVEEPPFVALGKNEKGYVIELRDMYFVAVKDAFDKLLEACPEEVLGQWQFVVLN